MYYIFKENFLLFLAGIGGIGQWDIISPFAVVGVICRGNGRGSRDGDDLANALGAEAVLEAFPLDDDGLNLRNLMSAPQAQGTVFRGGLAVVVNGERFGQRVAQGT